MLIDQVQLLGYFLYLRMLSLIPILVVADVMFVLLLKLLTIHLIHSVQLMTTDGMIIQMYLLKKAQTLW
jgi:hypothetical protein